MDSEEQLRSASDQMLGAVEQLKALESQKRSIPPNSARFTELSREIEKRAEDLADAASAQADLGEQIAQDAAGSGTPAPPINDIRRDVTTILAEWREAERRATAAGPGSSEEKAARADVDRLRAEYQAAQRGAGQHGGNGQDPRWEDPSS